MGEVFIKVTTRGSNIDYNNVFAIQSFDMVIAWPIVGLLIRWSMQTQSKLMNIKLWVEKMTVFLACDQGCSMGQKR